MLKRINNEKVSAVPVIGGADTRPVKGANLFSEPYANIFLLAKKKSGKSSVIYKIINDCSERNTKILAFCSTIYKDNVWIQIAELCKRKGLYFEPHTSLKEEGIDILEEFLISESAPDVATEETEKATSSILFDDDEPKAKKVKKPKKLAPEWLIILDDLSTELKSKSVEALLKKNRHLKSKVIISSQYLCDLKPESRKQIDTFLIFKGQPKEKLESVYKDADVSLDFPTFEQLYKKATIMPYSFFYVDTRNDSYRRNFSDEFVLDKESK